MRLRNLLLVTTALIPVLCAPALAGPEGAVVTGGQVNVQGQGTANVTVNQFSDKAIVNWHTFNIGANERTQFVQPNSNSVILNRVTGGLGPSEILGRLDANGKVFLVNRDGFIFGAGSVINAAGFLATTSDIKNDDFMAGRYNFSIPGRSDASIVNMGTITAANGGFAGLVAPGVRNSGTITANLGTVVLGAGNIFTLDMYGDKLITLGVNDEIAGNVTDVATGQTLKSLITNDGKLKANGGRVELTAAAARQVVDSVINTSGVIEANSVGVKDGQIILGAATSDTKGAGLPTQTVKISGKLSAAGRKAGTKGGTILVTGEDIQVTRATIDASGRDGGGKVMIGGDWGGGNPNTALVSNQSARLEGYKISNATTVSVDSTTKIDASAKDRGNGGKVVLWSNKSTSFAGTILALGGREIGNGGFVETSSHGRLDFTGNVDTRAPNGKSGTLLLDPLDLYIDQVDGPSRGASSVMTNIQVQTLLAMGNLVITTKSDTADNNYGDIHVNAAINWTGDTSLTLSAYRNIGIYAPITHNAGSGNLVLRSDNTGTGTGTVHFGETQEGIRKIDFSGSTGTVSIYYNPDGPQGESFITKYQNGNNYSGAFTGNSSQLKSYMLVNTVDDLQLIYSNLAGSYALGRDIDAKSVPNFAPLINFDDSGRTVNFTGILDGNGGLGKIYTISNLTIAPTDSTTSDIGLFAAIGSSGVVRNLILANASIMATTALEGPGQTVGVVAGRNSGTISNVTVVDSTISNNGETNAVVAGGLVGRNESGATISNSRAAVNVTVGDSTTSSQENNAGGLAGVNLGSITASSASGIITGGAHSNVGGLVGRNETSGTIASSFATGNVNTSGGQNTAGGLVGFNFGSILNSYASGQIGGSSSDVFFSAIAGGLVGVNAATGTITGSYATGAVTGGTNSTVGGFVGSNNGTISNSYASGNVTGGSAGYFGGFVGTNDGNIANSHATGTVTGANGIVAAGFAALNYGTITQSFATGAVSGGDNSFLGGLVALNYAVTGFPSGIISQAFAVGAVTGGANSYVGGLVALNGGSIDQTFAAGLLTGGTGSTLGGLVASNNVFAPVNPPNGPAAPPAFSTTPGTATNSYWDTQTTGQSASAGGTPLTTAQLIAANPTGFDSSAWTTGGGNYPCLNGICAPAPKPEQPAKTVDPVTPVVPVTPVDPVIPTDPQPKPESVKNTPVTSPQLVAAASLITDRTGNDPTPDTTLADNPPAGSSGGQGPGGNGKRPPVNQVPPPGLGPLPSGMPPLNETRFLSNEVVMQLGTTITPEAIAALTRSLGLEIISQQNFDALGRTVFRFRIASHLSVRDVIQAIETNSVYVSAQPSYTYALTQDAAQADLAQADLAGAPADTNRRGDAAQYIVDKLHLTEAHSIATGRDVKVAVIDSEIDANHPDLQGVITATYDALPSADQTPHPHGTGMAGAIASHRRLLGIAPRAKLLAVRAFGTDEKGAQGTSMNIVKGLEWAVQQGAEVINMSFAGPRDPILQQAIKKLSDDGVIMIAAAGNAGPKSPPLFPGADANVIAVSATDMDDKVFKNANRGKYVAIAAPGVDILVPAPDGGYQLTTGTSVAAAHISGVVALLKERNPQLKAADVRNILAASARYIGPVKTDVGAGLVDPMQALSKGGPTRSAEAR
jgi:filamentous hemagglutinin family protein